MTIQAKFSTLAMACMFCAISTGQVHAEIRPVRDVQKALADQGFDAGSPDGIWGSKSVAALKGFQRAHGLTPSGVVTQDSLKALFPPAKAELQTPAAPVDLVAAPIVPSVDLKPEVLSSEPVTTLSSQVSPPAPAIPVANRSGSKSGDSSGYLVIVFLIIVAFLFSRRKSRKSSVQPVRSKPGDKSGRSVEGRRAAR